MRPIVLALALASLASLGCTTVGGTTQRGMDRYIRADYPGALDMLAEVSDKEDKMNDKTLVRYLVFRGLAHYRLGQRDQALLFLSRGKHVYAAGEPKWLHPGAVMEMDRALADLGQGAPPAPDAPPAGAQTTIVVVPDAPVR